MFGAPDRFGNADLGPRPTGPVLVSCSGKAFDNISKQMVNTIALDIDILIAGWGAVGVYLVPDYMADTP